MNVAAQQMTRSSNHDLALKLAEGGIPTFPCLETPLGMKGAKAPYTQNGFHAATTDTNQINAWWQQWPGALPGLPTGSTSGISVIDLDINEETGEATGVQEAKHLGLDHADAVRVATPSGGLHLMFAHVEGVRSSAKQVASHIDIRGDGGYVIAPGTVLPDGTCYMYRGASLSQAMLAGTLPRLPIERIEAAKSASRQKQNSHQVGKNIVTPLASTDEITELLNHIPADVDYQTWLNVLMALHERFGGSEEGLELADQWSAQGSKYTPGEVEAKWRGFKGGGITFASIPAIARHHGADLSAIGRKYAATSCTLGPRIATIVKQLDKGGSSEDQAISTVAAFRHEDLDLIRDSKERPIWNMENALRLLASHGDWSGVLGFNAFANQRVLLQPIVGESDCEFPRPLGDDDYAAALAWFNRNGFPQARNDIVQSALRKVCRENSFDPLVEFLDGLNWDKVERVAGWLSTYCGAADDEYTSEVGKRWLISAVARGLKPGCKADCMLVLEGPQGRRKSTALATLAGSDWFSDSLPQMGSKDASSYLRGKWIVEVSELESMRKDVDQIKAFLSRQAEIYRPAYAREEVTEKRRCVFAGTTNKDDWQRDETGGRRFWPVKVGSIDIDGLKQAREQLWAEAVALYRAGQRWWLEGEVAETAQAVVAERQADDPWRSEIERLIRGRSEITTKEILAGMQLLASDQTPSMSRRVAQQLRVLGWEKTGRVTSGENKGQYLYGLVKQSEER